MKRNSFLGGVIVSCICLFAGNQDSFGQKYATATINPEQIINAPAVIREDIQEVVVGASGEFILKNKLVVTIFKKEANDLAVLQVDYEPKIKIKSINGNVYDLIGNTIKKGSKSDISDYSNFNSFSIYEDNRIKVMDLRQLNFPYTVEFEYEVEYPNLFFLPNWYPQSYPKIPVEIAHGKYIYPKASKLRFFTQTIDEKYLSTKELEGGMVEKSWKIENIEAFEPEIMLPLDENPTKVVFVGASEFEYEGYKGDLSSWESMGKWIASLNSGKDVLTPELKAKVNELVSGLETTEEKTKAIYEYLQKNTRYVSIQLGIGGFMPFEALTVEKYGYGDCKALSNFMGAMLKEAGIPSNYVLIYGGESKRKVYAEFPRSYFNHAILAVPTAKDTIWLECTSQTNPFGYLGNFTSDRQALMITENGGKLVRTPKYSKEKNTLYQEAVFEVEETGKAKGTLHFENAGLQAENGDLLTVSGLSATEKKNWLLTNLTFSSFDILDFNFTPNRTALPSVKVEAQVEVKSLASKSGTRIFLQPNQLNVYSMKISSKPERKSSFERRMGFIDEDLITYKLPEGYNPESVPSKVFLESDFGIYSAEYHLEERSLVYKRKLEMNDGVYQAGQFPAFVDFVTNIEKADKTKVVLKKVQ
jgi:transglutaminase-like putative cysteine protease